MAAKPPWPVRLTAAAEADFLGIVRWTAERFGDAQARGYADILVAALKDPGEQDCRRRLLPRT